MRRREFNHAVAALATGAAMMRTSAAKEADGGITDVQGIRVGHFTDSRRPTGCTVLIFDKGATAGVDVRGSAPGTRETDLLNPINTTDCRMFPEYFDPVVGTALSRPEPVPAVATFRDCHLFLIGTTRPLRSFHADPNRRNPK